MIKKINRKFAAAVAGALLAGGLGFCLHYFPLGRGLSHTSYDLLLVARGERLANEAAIVYLDEKSHLALNQPLNAPWDRALHAKLIDRLTAAGAKAIVFDIVFSDPALHDPAADQALAKALKASGRVILAADRVPVGHKESKVIPPIDLLRDNAAGIGSAEVQPDPDLVVRKHTPEEELPSLSWAAAEFLGAPATTNNAVRQQSRWMNYYGPPNSLPGKSYCDALDPARVADEFFRGKVVFVGSRIFTKFAGERKDEYRNPFGLFMSKAMTEEHGAMFVPGVEIQATACLNLLRGDWLGRLPLEVERAIIVVVGLLFGFVVVQLSPKRAILLAMAALLLLVLVCMAAFALMQSWFVILIVAVQIAAALAWSISFNSIQLYVQKRLAEYTLGLYLSPKLVKKFSADPKLLQPGAQKQTVTLFFSDIADFTKLSEGMDSDHLAQLMNSYFAEAVARCIHKTDGTVVKYIGDAIFAFWNAPEPQADHALRACQAALYFCELGKQPINGVMLRTRIGLHSGQANVGNFGSPERVDYTALGESVNLASRLEGLNKYLGTSCLISGDTKVGIGELLVTRALGSFQLKGFENLVQVHELVGWPDEAESTRPWRDAFAEALNNYEQRNLAFAEMGFRRVLELRPHDGPVKFYLERIAELAEQQLPDDWVTHTILREK